MRHCLLIAATLLGLPLVALGADDPKTTKPAPASPAPPPPLTPEAEAGAMALVRQHLPELARVLEPLKATNPAEYGKAMTELAAEARSQADLRAKNPARADLALEAWQARTRVELIAAQLANSPGSEQESQLRTAIEARVDVDIRRQRFEVEQAEASVQRVRDNLARVEKNRDRAVESLRKAEQSRSAKVENRFRALNPTAKPSPTVRAKPKATSGINAQPVPGPTPTPPPDPAASAVPMPASPDLSHHAVPMPSPLLANAAVPMPSPPVEGQDR